MDDAYPVVVVGVDLGETDSPLAAHPALDGADVLAGSSRLLDRLTCHPAQKFVLGRDVNGFLDRLASLRGQGLRVAVLASGDPLFFGIGATLVRHFGRDTVAVYPAVSSLQLAASRLGLEWSGVRAVSMHGRADWSPLAHAVLGNGPVCVLTDPVRTPAAIAAFLLERGCGQYQAHVFSALGVRDERAWSGTTEDLALRDFPQPNVLFLLPDPSVSLPCRAIGQPDAAFAQDKGLLTKWPVRATALAALRVERRHTVWDLGSGSGSVAVEASFLACQGRVLAVERDGNRVRDIAANRRAFGAANLEIVHGLLPECLNLADPASGTPLPSPNRVFIGGGLSGDPARAQALLDAAWEHLAPGGRMVVACVLLHGMERAAARLRDLAGSMETTMVQAACSSPLAGDMHLKGLNPVFLLAVEKP